jgi:hypothetical protein
MADYGSLPDALKLLDQERLLRALQDSKIPFRFRYGRRRRYIQGEPDDWGEPTDVCWEQSQLSAVVQVLELRETDPAAARELARKLPERGAPWPPPLALARFEPTLPLPIRAWIEVEVDLDAVRQHVTAGRPAAEAAPAPTDQPATADAAELKSWLASLAAAYGGRLPDQKTVEKAAHYHFGKRYPGRDPLREAMPDRPPGRPVNSQD